MKKLFLLSLAIITFSPLAQASEKDITVIIDGMYCQPCVETVQKKFNKEPSVKNTVVILEDKSAFIDLKNGQDLSDVKIKKIVEWGGYDLVEIKRPD